MKAAKTPKYRNKRRPGCVACGGAALDKDKPCPSCGGEVAMFDSGAELERWAFLIRWREAGLITGLQRQARFDLHGYDGVTVVARLVLDHVYSLSGKTAPVYEDVKGGVSDTPLFRLKRKLFEAEYGPLQIWRKK